VADEKIVEAVVVVIAYADALSPAGMYETSGRGDVAESAVTIIFEEMRVRFPAFWKTFQAPAVDQENVQPAVVIIVVESYSATGGLEQEFIFVFATEDRFCVEAGFFGDVQKVDAEGGRRRGSGRRRGRLLRCDWRLRSSRKERTNSCKDIFQRQDERGTAERLKEAAARKKQSSDTFPKRTGYCLARSRVTLWPFRL